MKILFVLLLLPSLSLAQSYPSPTFQNTTTRGNATIGGTLGVTGVTSLSPTTMASAPGLTVFAWPTFTTTSKPYIYTHGVPSGAVTSGQANYNYMAIDNDSLNTTGVGGPGGSTILGVAGSFNSTSLTGSRTGIGAGVTINGPTGNSSGSANGVFYTGAAFSSTTNSDDGGTSGTQRGNLVGANPLVRVGPNVLHWLSAVGQETDVIIDPTSVVDYKNGTQIIGNGPQGVLEDSALVIGRGLNTNFTQNPGWNIGLAFGAPNVFWPVSATGTIIGTQASTQGGNPTVAAALGVDFSAVTFSTAFLKSTGFLVDGSGALTAASFKSGANAGVSCSGALTGSAVVTNGIVTHC